MNYEVQFLVEQIIALIREHGAGLKTADLCRKHWISDSTFYNPENAGFLNGD